MSKLCRQAALLAALAAVTGLTLGGRQSAVQSRQEAGEATDAYAARRAAVRDKLQDGLVVLFGTTEGAGSESFTAFRQESNFFYLTGLAEPGGVLLLAPRREAAGAAQTAGEILFLPARNPREEAWTGPQLDPKDPATAASLGVTAVREADALEDELGRYSRYFKVIYALTENPHGGEAERAVQRERVERLRKMAPSAEIKNIRPALGELREVKSAAELQQIRRAVDCTMEAQRAAGQAVAPGKLEYEIAALAKYEMERRGCTVTGFDPIIGAGPHATMLHYIKAQGRMQQGDLVVVDIGGEYGDYSADITRTFPASGTFTARQREIYEIVLGAQNAVIDAVRPGLPLYGRGRSLHQIAYDYLNSHGKDRNGEPLGKYFTHGVGHSVGLDVHDPMGPGGVLKEGMVLALEPGLYLPEENIGVRIEDMVVVTKDGSELLTKALPRTAADVEQWMGER
jgi:Xaa-Pro aminopeptidase